MINLAQYFVGKSEAIQAPVVAELVRFVEVLVPSLENPEGNSMALIDSESDCALEVYSTLPAAGPTAVACFVLGSMPTSATPPTPPRTSLFT